MARVRQPPVPLRARRGGSGCALSIDRCDGQPRVGSPAAGTGCPGAVWL